MGKGGDFERDISKSLTKWLTGKEKPYKYWRMPGSGGLATIHEECVDLSGDIRSLSSEADFLTEYWSIEAKNGYPKTSFWQHFKNIKHFNIKDFWTQCTIDASKSNRKGMLIYRKKGRNPIVGIDLETNSLLYSMNEDLNKLPSIIMNWDDDLVSIIFYDFNDFLNTIKPDDIKELLYG